MLRRRYIGEVLIVLILALACTAIGAHAAPAAQGSAKAKAAATNISAVIKASKIQESDCAFGNFLLYACVHSYYVFPSCYETKINQPGHPQHVCGGIFVRQNRVSGALQYCHTTYFLSPWNRELRPSGYSCAASPPS